MCRLLTRVFAGGAALSLSGCLLGPDYARPPTPEPEAWHASLGEGLSPASPERAALATWWTVLGDPLLSDLVSQALDRNLDVQVAHQRVREARQRRAVAEAGLWPTLRGRATVSPARTSHARSQATGLEALWNLDVFGKQRRTIEAAEGDRGASEEDLHSALVNVAAEVVQSYIDLRTFQAHLGIADANLAAETETAQLASWRAQAGLTNTLDVLQATADAAQRRAQIPSLRASLEEAKNRLALLEGETPGALSSQLDSAQPNPSAPPEVAVGIPADALRQRPDVRRAERQLAAETARIGAAKAEAYPTISLSGAVGTGVIGPATFTSPQSITAAAAAEAVQVLFDHGAIRATIKGQKAVRGEALARFQSTVLAALNDVEAGIIEYREEQQRERGLAEASASAASAATISRERYAAGLVDFQVVLDAERSLYSIEEQRVSSQGRVIADLVRLYRSLGGGWSAET